MLFGEATSGLTVVGRREHLSQFRFHGRRIAWVGEVRKTFLTALGELA